MQNTAEPVIVRQAAPADLPSFTNLVQRSMEDSYSNPELGISSDWFAGRIFADQGIQDSFERQLTPDMERRAWVALRSGELVGALTSRDSGDYVEIIKLHVAPEVRGHRIGSQLMAWAMSSWNERPMGLEVLHSNEGAIRFYERFGFRIDSTRDPIRYDNIPVEEFPAGHHPDFWAHWMHRKPGTIE